MSASGNQPKLVHGYCRISYPNNITLRIIEIIIQFFSIKDCWAFQDYSIQLYEHDTFAEWPWNDTNCIDKGHKSLFGDFMFETSFYPQTVQLKWDLQFCIPKVQPQPLFIGISNNNAQISTCPIYDKNLKGIQTKHKMYTGFAFSFFHRSIDDPWCNQFYLHEAMDGQIYQTDPCEFDLQSLINDVPSNQETSDCVFGEIEFIVILDNDNVTTSIKIYSHPSTLQHGKESFHDWMSQDFFKHNKDLCCLSVSLSRGSSIKIKQFDICGYVNCDFRQRCKSIFSLYKF